MKPKVSVIIPVLNRKELLLRCLDSIERQDYRPLELIIVDNGSTDGTPEVAMKWRIDHSLPDLEVKVVSETKAGACAARNRGLSVASGEFALFFDSDDTMRTDLISRAIREFEKAPETEIVCWRCDLHQLDGTIRRPPFNPKDAMESHLIHALLRTQGYMARTESFRVSGGWNESLPGWNDWELGVRMLIGNPNIVGINEVLVDVFAQTVSITGSNFSSKAGCWEKSLAAVRHDIETSNRSDKKRLLAIVGYREVILAAHYAKEGRMDLAKQLKEKAIKHQPTRFQGLLLSAVFHYTKHGGRGAWKIVGRFLFNAS